MTRAEQNDEMARNVQARLLTQWCREQGMDVDSVIVDALTKRLQEES